MITDHREAVDEVRAWLVSIRGGSPFLSPSDGWRLVRWLDDGVAVSAIARAIERASEARRARRARRPLGLADARHYLGVTAAPPVSGDVAPDRLCAAIRSASTDDPNLGALADRVSCARGTSDDVFRQALQAFREFFDERWAALPPAERDALLAAARAGYGDWLADLNEGAQLALVEEAARDALRAKYPALTADLVWTALQPEDPAR